MLPAFNMFYACDWGNSTQEVAPDWSIPSQNSIIFYFCVSLKMKVKLHGMTQGYFDADGFNLAVNFIQLY